jgi:hypothetical protein
MNKKSILMMLSIFFIVLSSKYSFSASGWTNGEDNDEEKRSGSPLIRAQQRGSDTVEPSLKVKTSAGSSTEKIDATYDSLLRDHKEYLTKTRSAYDENKKKLNEIKNKELDVATKEAKQSWWPSVGAKVGNWFGTEPDPNVLRLAKENEAKLESAQKKYDAQVSILDQQGRDINERESKYNEDLNSKRKSYGSLEKEINLLQAHLQRSDAFRDLKDLNMEYMTTRDQLDAIEKQLDRSAVGNYLQVKLGKFMNSESFCKAAYQCNGKNGAKNPLTRANISQSDFRTEIFGDSTLNPGRSEESKDSETLK